MTEEALKALKASIRVWRKKYKLLSENVGRRLTVKDGDVDRVVCRYNEVIGRVPVGASDCPLCKVFRGRYHRDRFTRCCGCPVSESTGDSSCRGTPYHAFSRALPSWGCSGRVTKALVEACKAELDFLVSLLPAKKKAPKAVRPEGRFLPGDRVELLVDDWDRKKGERATLVTDDQSDIRHGNAVCMPLYLKFRDGRHLWFRRDQVKLVRKAKV